jgi:hypothetical protein
MKNFEFDISIKAKSEGDAIEKLKAVSLIMEKLDTEILKKIAETVSHPAKLAMVKLKLGF